MITFSIVIISITKIFKSKCLDGEVFDKQLNKCRPVCNDDEKWYPDEGKCMRCPPNYTYDDNTEKCLKNCKKGEVRCGTECINEHVEKCLNNSCIKNNNNFMCINSEIFNYLQLYKRYYHNKTGKHVILEAGMKNITRDYFTSIYNINEYFTEDGMQFSALNNNIDVNNSNLNINGVKPIPIYRAYGWNRPGNGMNPFNSNGSAINSNYYIFLHVYLFLLLLHVYDKKYNKNYIFLFLLYLLKDFYIINGYNYK